MSNSFDSENTVPLDTAIKWTTQWRDQYSKSNPEALDSEIIRAFWIPMEDIQNLAKFTTADAVRAYLCVEDAGVNQIVKVVLVPVINNVDILSVDALPGRVGGDGGSTIYDFTQPCPVQCDPDSPLYGPPPGHPPHGGHPHE